ncbi:hexose carrier protein HEX6-like [Cryptomeria japonica]|uniref:hexose carrier protein HEX6-like n=1 Tax=Cryptomeria japonica TaxID=3369 RepID=UPI0027DA27F5|nr:hexose carrier protein HEX6-like [Cryptomeria japonica]
MEEGRNRSGSSPGVKEYKGGVTPFVVGACIVAATGGLVFGYDNGISGGVTSMDPFLVKFFPATYKKMHLKEAHTSAYCKFDSQILTTFTSSMYIAGLIASMVASTVTRAYGRKPSILVGGLSVLVGAALNGGALNVGMLILGRIMLGIGIGFADQAVPLYLSEMAPKQMRGALNSGFQLFVAVGGLSASLTNYGTAKIHNWGWRLSLGLAVIPAIILSLGSLWLPETPNSLMEREGPEKAKAMLQRIRGTVDVEEELSDMMEAKKISETVKHPLRNMMQRKYRPQLVMAVAIPLFQQLTGINAIAFYTPVLFRTIGFETNASLMSAVIIGVIATAATVLSMFAVDKYGRRLIFLEGGIQMLVSQVIIAIILGIKFDSSGDGSISKGYAYLLLVMICIYVVGFSWSWGPLGWLVPSEIFSLEVRSIGQSIVVSVNLLLIFIVAQGFLAMLCHFKFGIFLFFAIWVVIMTLFVYFFLPETKNIGIEEMNSVWKEHWFWKRFVNEEIPIPMKSMYQET